jgi:hypothetical protein
MTDGITSAPSSVTAPQRMRTSREMEGLTHTEDVARQATLSGVESIKAKAVSPLPTFKLWYVC